MKTYEEIWSTLSQVNCKGLLEKKNGLTYLSWANAWGILMKHFPESTYTFYDNTYEENGTVMVHCSVQIGQCGRTMWLPVLNYANKSIQSPSAFEISNTRMRCLVKCIAMLGLGHYVYCGEDLPSVNDSPIVAEAIAPRMEPLSSGGHILYNDNLTIPCGNGKGKSYEDIYCDNLGSVDKHIKHFNSKRDLPENQQLHLDQLRAYKRAIQTEPSNGVA